MLIHSLRSNLEGRFLKYSARWAAEGLAEAAAPAVPGEEDGVVDADGALLGLTVDGEVALGVGAAPGALGFEAVAPLDFAAPLEALAP